MIRRVVLSLCCFLVVISVSVAGEKRGKSSAQSSLRSDLTKSGFQLIISCSAPELGVEVTDLFLINADGSNPRRLTYTPKISEWYPRISPDGKKVAYIRQGGSAGGALWLLNLKTGKEEKLLNNAMTVGWSPSGRKLIVGWGGSHGEHGGQKPNFRILDLMSRKVTLLHTGQGGMFDIDVSPDGRYIVFEIRDFRGYRFTICYMSLSDRKIKIFPPLGRGGECHPAFSRDGQYICWNAGGALAIRIFDPTQPTGTRGDVRFYDKKVTGGDPCGRWSPDSRYIALAIVSDWNVPRAPFKILRVSDGRVVRFSPRGWLGPPWGYDWMPEAENINKGE